MELLSYIYSYVGGFGCSATVDSGAGGCCGFVCGCDNWYGSSSCGVMVVGLTLALLWLWMWLCVWLWLMLLLSVWTWFCMLVGFWLWTSMYMWKYDDVSELEGHTHLQTVSPYGRNLFLICNMGRLKAKSSLNVLYCKMNIQRVKFTIMSKSVTDENTHCVLSSISCSMKKKVDGDRMFQSWTAVYMEDLGNRIAYSSSLCNNRNSSFKAL